MSEVPFVGDGGEPTENVESLTASPIHPHFELRVVCGSHSEYRSAFWQSEVSLKTLAPSAFPSDTNWIARLTGEQVMLTEVSQGQSLTLAVGEGVVVEGVRVWLLDVRQPPSATLEGVTHPYGGRSWPLSGPVCWIGRRGKRLNHIELDHPTISRAHATVMVEDKGSFQLLREAGASVTAVNGENLQVGATADLVHGDLLSFGQLQFRFQTRATNPKVDGKLQVRTLGTFEVRLGDGQDLGPQIRNEKSRWLMALLAVNWGQPCSVEAILEQFWPELPGTRGRKNLSYTLATLREGLGLEESEFESLIVRMPSSLQLHSARLGSHDLIEVQKLVGCGLPLSSEAALERLLRLDRGPFLEGCYEDWAERIRTRLSLDVLETLRSSAVALLDKGEFRLSERAARALQERDSLSEDGVFLLMQSALKQGLAAEALEIYERFQEHLPGEGLEPSTELMRLYYQASLGLS